MARKTILVLSYVAPYNRQGYDLCEALRKEGYTVTLFQKDGETDKAKGILGISCSNPHGTFHKIQRIWNVLKFGLRSICVTKEIVICVGKPMLLLGAIYSILGRARLVWYSLEHSKFSLLDKFIYQYCVKGYIDVEENRRNSIFLQYGEKNISAVCHNMPHLHISPICGGKLRNYLVEHHSISYEKN